MSERPGFDPASIRAARAARLTESPLRAASGDDPPRRRADDADAEADDGDATDVEEMSDAPAIREGLPPSYRMRHEPHYVETLVAHLTPPAPTSVAPVTPVDSGLNGAAGAAVGAIARALADALDTIDHSLAGLTMAGRPLRERVAVDVVRTEAVRARWLTDAAAVLQLEPLPALDEVDLSQVLRSVDGLLAGERRLTGEGPTIGVPAGPLPVFGDERLLTSAVGGILAALRMLVQDRGDLSKVTVVTGETRAAAVRTIVVTQSAVRVSTAALSRLFDAAWPEHPAGPMGAVLLAAARRIVTAHGGSLELTAVDAGGFRLTLSLPAAGR